VRTAKDPINRPATAALAIIALDGLIIPFFLYWFSVLLHEDAALRETRRSRFARFDSRIVCQRKIAKDLFQVKADSSYSDRVGFPIGVQLEGRCVKRCGSDSPPCGRGSPDYSSERYGTPERSIITIAFIRPRAQPGIVRCRQLELESRHNHMDNPNIELAKEASADLHHFYIGPPPRFGSAEKALATCGH
jgi:hypothetical protein